MLDGTEPPETLMRAARPLLLALASLLLAPTGAFGQGQPCTDPDYRAFDFWAGDWIAYDKATHRELGRDIVDRFHNGCVILENWVGAGGFNGTSLNMYDMADGKWHQTWTDNQGGVTFLEGGIQDGKMVMEGAVPDPQAADGHGRIRMTWQTMPEGGVREIGERSTDGGATWQPDFDIVYVANKLAGADTKTAEPPAGEAPSGGTEPPAP